MAELTITAGNFETEVQQSAQPVLVDFWAEWCGPCRMLAPVVESIAKKYEGKLKVGKVNVDDEAELASRFGVSAIPTVVLIRDGKVEKTAMGFQSQAQLEAALGIDAL